VRLEVDRDQIRDRAADIFAGAPYRRERPIWQRIVEWLAERLGFPAVSGGSGAGSGVGNVVSTVVIVALVIMVLALLWFVLRNWRPSARRSEDDAVVEVHEERSTKEWRSQAQELEQAGEWKQALLARYRELCGTLVDLGVLASLPGRTTGEFRIELNDVAPGVAAEFDDATTLFELPWYAGASTGPEENSRFRALAATVVVGAPGNNSRGSSDELVRVGVET